ncbi:MAG: hypothetical protein KGK08_12245 [Acidobacteriota bacterium]|nr:hypothetical protein [Acidobacteriota bacterium]
MVVSLALAAMCLFPASALARPHRAAVAKHGTRAHAQHIQAAKAKTQKPAHKTHRRERSADPPDPVMVTRVHSWVRRHPQSTLRAAATPQLAPQPATPHNATADDFLRAAGGTQVADAASTAAAPAAPALLYNKRGRVIMPPPLKGSHEILLRQNQVADQEGLNRVQDDADLDSLRAHGQLVALPLSSALTVDERLPYNRRYTRPWAALFLQNLAAAHYARFHTPLQVNSAVRTVEFQQHLQHINGNAAPAEGDIASPHLTGQAIDLAKHGLSLTEIAWLRGYLLPLVQQGKVDVEEEFKQSCFHISVYKRYLPTQGVPQRDVATARTTQTPALAAAIR